MNYVGYVNPIKAFGICIKVRSFTTEGNAFRDHIMQILLIQFLALLGSSLECRRLTKILPGYKILRTLRDCKAS